MFIEEKILFLLPISFMNITEITDGRRDWNRPNGTRIFAAGAKRTLRIVSQTTARELRTRHALGVLEMRGSGSSCGRSKGVCHSKGLGGAQGQHKPRFGHYENINVLLLFTVTYAGHRWS